MFISFCTAFVNSPTRRGAFGVYMKPIGINNVSDLLTPRHRLSIDGFFKQQTKKGMEMKKLFVFAGVAAVVSAGAYATDDAATLLAKKTVTSKNYVDTALATKQPILTAQDGDYAVLYPGDGEDDGAVRTRAIITSVSDYDEGNELVTVGGVNTALAGKQNALPNNTVGKLVTYNGAMGSVGSADVYDSTSTYSTQQNALVKANQVNAAVSAGFNGVLTCANQDCTLWQIDTTMSGTYVPQNQQ